MSRKALRPRLVISIVLILTVAVLSSVKWPSEANVNKRFVGGVIATETVTDVAGTVDGNADPGDTLEFTTVVNNTGPQATNVQLADTVPSITTFVGGSTLIGPIAGSDTYETIGNTQLEVSAAQTASPAVFVNGNVKSNDSDPDGNSGTFSITAFDATSTLGGTVSMTLATGAFVYTPPVNPASSSDTFTYTLTDTSGITSVGTVSITIKPNKIWYVKNNNGVNGSGRSNDPFNNLASAQTASAAGDIIYVFTGSGTTNQTTGITLKANQALIGEGVALVSPVTVNGGIAVLRGAGTKPQISNTNPTSDAVTLSDGNTVSGLTVTGATRDGITGSGKAGFTADSLTVQNNTNVAVDLIAFTGTVTITNSTISTVGNQALTINNGTAAVTVNNTNTLAGGSGSAISVINRPVSAGAIAIGATITGGQIQALTNASGTISFTGTQTLSNTTVNGITLSNNTGATISFSGTLNVTTTTGIPFQASGGGTLNVSGTANLTSGAATNGLFLSGMTVGTGVTFSSINTTGATTGISLTLVTGTVAVNGGTISGGTTGISFSGPSTSLSLTAMTVTGGTTGISGSPFGTFTVAGTGLSATGQALSLTSGTFAGSGFTSTTSTGGTNNVLLSNVTGTISLGNGALSNASGDSFLVSGNVGSVSYGGSITSGSAHSVNVTGKSGGTVTFNGAINDTDTGISLTSNTGATINFQAGITVNVTGANNGFVATGGGTVNVTGTNTLATATGTALNVANTTIGASGLTFQSISSNGAAKGIILNTTGASGGLTVSGTGGTCSGSNQSGCTGGTIQGGTTRGAELISTKSPTLNNMYFNGNATSAVACGDDVSGSSNTTCNAAIFMSSVTNPTFNKIYINGTGSNDTGMIGNTVSAMTIGTLEIANFTNTAKTPFNFQNLTGTTGVTGLNIHNNSGLHNVFVSNNTGTADLTFTGPVLTSNSGSGNPDQIQVNSYVAGTTLNVTATNVNITASSINTGNGVSFQANSGSAMTGILNGGVVTGTNGILMQEAGTNTTFNFTVTGLTNVANHNLGSSGITVGKANGTNATFTGTVTNNVITSATCGGGCFGISVGTYGVSGISTITVSGNNISGVDASAIRVTGGQGSSALGATIQGNNIHNPVAGNTSYAIDLYPGTQSGDAVCFAGNLGDMSSGHSVPANANTITGSWQSGGNPIEVGIFDNSVFKLLNYPNPNTNDTNAGNWVKASNGGLGTDAFHISPAGNFGAGAACAGFPPTIPEGGSSESEVGRLGSTGTLVEESAVLAAVSATGDVEPLIIGEVRAIGEPGIIGNVPATAEATSLVTSHVAETDYSALISEIASKIWEGIEPRASAFSGEAISTTPTFTLPATSSVTFKFRATVDNGPYQTGVDNITNVSTITGSFGSVQSSTASIPLDASPDLSVAASDAGAGTTQPGVTLTYNVVYSNAAGIARQQASGIKLTATLPTNTTLNVAGSPGWTCVASNCSKTVAGTVNADGAPHSVPFAVDVAANYPYSATANVTTTATVVEDISVHDNGADPTTPNISTATDNVIGVWGGVVDSNYANAANWSNSTLPASPQNISIPAAGGGANASPAISGNISVNGMVLVKDLTVNTGSTLLVNNTLALGANKVVAGTTPVGTVELAATTGQITRTSGFVAVTLKKDFSAAGTMPTDGNATGENPAVPDPSAPQVTTFLFPVGYGATYTPVTASNLTSTAGSTLAVTAVGTAAPGMTTNKSLQMYWIMAGTGSITADLLFDYGTTVEMGTLANYKVVHYPQTGQPQVLTQTCPGGPCVDTTANTIKVNGITAFERWWTAGESTAVPTAAEVTVAGRVLTQSGRGITGARVSITGQNGVTRTILTGPSGYYRFDGVDVGKVYAVTVQSTRYRFAPRQLMLNDAIGDLDFVAEP